MRRIITGVGHLLAEDMVEDASDARLAQRLLRNPGLTTAQVKWLDTLLQRDGHKFRKT